MSAFLINHQVMFTLVILALLAVIPLTVASDFAPSCTGGSNNLEYKGAVLAHIHRIGNGYGSDSSKEMHKHLSAIGYNYVQLNTFAYMRNRKDTIIYIGGDPSMATPFVENEIRNLHEAGFKVMLKPHIWIGGHDLDPDNWRSRIDFKAPAERAKWFSSYRDFILSQAALAERSGVEILVIGTELVGMCKYTAQWKEIIGKVREVYGGKLTYAAEGMNAKNIKFWDVLDYIGIDAYFPLS